MNIVEQNGYIICIGKNVNGRQLTQEEINAITAAMQNKPESREGFGHRLTTSFVWEEYKFPPQPEEEVDDAEALQILLGGTT